VAPSIAEMIGTGVQPEIPGLSAVAQPAFAFESAEEGQAAEVALQVIRGFERKLGSAEALREEGVQKQFAEEVRDLMQPSQGALKGIVQGPRIEKIVEVVAATVADRTISIPEIIVVPKRRITFRFVDFDLKDLQTINVRPIEEGRVRVDGRAGRSG
jgi:type III restriction enzyme